MSEGKSCNKPIGAFTHEQKEDVQYKCGICNFHPYWHRGNQLLNFYKLLNTNNFI